MSSSSDGNALIRLIAGLKLLLVLSPIVIRDNILSSVP
jgi:hypothetical protein